MVQWLWTLCPSPHQPLVVGPDHVLVVEGQMATTEAGGRCQFHLIQTDQGLAVVPSHPPP